MGRLCLGRRENTYIVTRAERRRLERAEKVAAKTPYSFLEDGGMNRRDKRRMERKMKPLLARLEKRQIAQEKKQKIVDEFLAEERKRIAEQGVMLLPGTEKLMGGR